MESSIIWLVKLLVAHLLSDFIFQTPMMVEDRNLNKIKSKYLYLHILITAIMAIAMIGSGFWAAIAILTATHYLIDLGKSYLANTFGNFIIDQIAHIAVIIFCWCYQFGMFPSSVALHNFYSNDSFWLFTACFLFLTYPSSIIIGKATEHWSSQITSSQTNATSANASSSPASGNASLVNAGKYIGMIERVIICILVYNAQYEAIGLLITGKSILRYNSANEEIKTEYLLVGTLISMLFAFAAGLTLKYLSTIGMI